MEVNIDVVYICTIWTLDLVVERMNLTRYVIVTIHSQCVYLDFLKYITNKHRFYNQVKMLNPMKYLFGGSGVINRFQRHLYDQLSNE